MKKFSSLIIVGFLLISMISMTLLVDSKNISLSSCEKSEIEKLEKNEVEYYALIIGIEKFLDVPIPEEYWIAETAIGVYDFLINCSNWKEENIKLLIDEEATKDTIQDSIITWLDDKEDENDVVLIFYTSHGWKTKLSQRKYGNAVIFTYNVTTEHKIEDKITDKEFDAWVDGLESKHIAIILESCYSGRMLSLRQKGRVVLAAGGKNLFCGVDDSDFLKFGIFAHYILEGFTGVADLNNDGWVTAEETFRYAKPHTIITSIWEQFPFIQKYGNKTIFWSFQVPHMYDRYFGGLPLIQLKEN